MFFFTLTLPTSLRTGLEIWTSFYPHPLHPIHDDTWCVSFSLFILFHRLSRRACVDPLPSEWRGTHPILSTEKAPYWGILNSDAASPSRSLSDRSSRRLDWTRSVQNPPLHPPPFHSIQSHDVHSMHPSVMLIPRIRTRLYLSVHRDAHAADGDAHSTSVMSMPRIFGPCPPRCTCRGQFRRCTFRQW